MDGFILGFPCSLQAKMEIRGTNVITGLSFFFLFLLFAGSANIPDPGFIPIFFFFPSATINPFSGETFSLSRSSLSLSLSVFSTGGERRCRSFLSR